MDEFTWSQNGEVFIFRLKVFINTAEPLSTAFSFWWLKKERGRDFQISPMQEHTHSLESSVKVHIPFSHGHMDSKPSDKAAVSSTILRGLIPFPPLCWYPFPTPRGNCATSIRHLPVSSSILTPEQVVILVSHPCFPILVLFRASCYFLVFLPSPSLRAKNISGALSREYIFCVACSPHVMDIHFWGPA